jgi:hypothetical protein
MRELSPLLWRYRVGLRATVIAFAVPLFLPTLASPLPFALFIAAVLASAWHGGLAPGLVATSRTAQLSRRPGRGDWHPRETDGRAGRLQRRG